MTALRRGFVAVYPPEAVCDALAARVAKVHGILPVAGERVRWVAREQWHCTVEFLGPVDDVKAVTGVLRDATGRVPPVEGVQLAGGGAFPRAGRATVLWAGFADGAGVTGLAALAGAVERASASLGLGAAARPFRAHVTLARTSRAVDLRAAIGALGPGEIGSPFTVGELALVSSDLGPGGAAHEVVARFPLGET